MSEKRRVELRDMIAAKIRDANYRWRSGSDDDYYQSLAESVVDLFPVIRRVWHYDEGVSLEEDPSHGRFLLETAPQPYVRERPSDG